MQLIPRSTTTRLAVWPVLAMLTVTCTGAAPQAPGAPASAACGTIAVRGSTPPADPAAAQVERCFLAAYQSCQPATLTLESHGVDLTTTMTFTIQPASPCQIAGTTQSAQVAGFRSTSSFTCARLVEKDGGLLFVACDKAGDIFVPPPAAR